MANQYPITDWLEPSDWYELVCKLRLAKPINGYGLIYGHQMKETPGAMQIQDHLAEIKRDLMAYFEKLNDDKRKRLVDTIASVDDFLSKLPMELYGLNYALGMDGE